MLLFQLNQEFNRKLPLDAATVARECMYGVSQRSITGLPMISRCVSAAL